MKKHDKHEAYCNCRECKPPEMRNLIDMLERQQQKPTEGPRLPLDWRTSETGEWPAITPEKQ